MKSVAAMLAWNQGPAVQKTLTSIQQCENVKATVAVVPSGEPAPVNTATLNVSGLWSRQAILDSLRWVGDCGADYVLVITGPGAPVFSSEGLLRLMACMRDTQGSVVYSDYWDVQPDGSSRQHPLIAYQPGSIRDTFNFGPAMLLNGSLLQDIRADIEKSATDLAYGGLYDLRLRLTERAPVYHLPEPTYSCNQANDGQGISHFAYVDPRNRDYQIEMETVATAHLKRIGAFIGTPDEKTLDDGGDFPVTASVVIPVKNRVRTIADAVQSALSQKTEFEYNVIVVDNHSTDGTTEILRAIAQSDSRLIHHVPKRTDLLIGGCWNEAIYCDSCGKYAVQLDSDDLYDGTEVLGRIVAEFTKKKCALLIGSYTVVDFGLQTLPPGLIDHREWTDSNGQNNALRIAGLGAPRSYHVPTLRQFGFPNVSYGEDYAVVLRMCRSYRVGRIFDSLYWCRRWEENSDSALPLETANRYDLYKDRLRSIEIAARIRREDCR